MRGCEASAHEASESAATIDSMTVVLCINIVY